MAKKALKEVRQLAFDEMFRAPTAGDVFAIDFAFPEEFADQLAQQETFNKHLFRPNTYLHKWWARRCGTTFRAILKQFVPDPERRDFYAPGGLEGKTVLDPMMGGGTTLHEAIRLGAKVIGADIDPIPLVQARASLTQASLRELREAFDAFFADLYRRVGHYFQTECPDCKETIDAQYILHGLLKRCACGEAVQIDQYELRQEEDRTLRISPHSWEITENEEATKRRTRKGLRLIKKGEAVCPDCGQKFQELLDRPFYARYVPIAIVGKCEAHGIFFRSPGPADLNRIQEADRQRAALDFGPVERFAVKNGPKSSDLLSKNVKSYLDVFSSRQLLYLHHSIQLLSGYRGVAKLNLALLVSTSLEFNSMLCGYKGWFKRRPGAIRHVFALHAYAFQYTVAENNPVNREKSSGNLQLLFRDRIERGRKWAVAPVERKIARKGETQVIKIPGELDGGIEAHDQTSLMATQRQAFWLIHGDSRDLPIDDHTVDFVVTDPPYYDNVQYSDLAAFFRVWLARLLPTEVNWAYDEAQSAVATKASDDDSSFMTVISGIFQECGRVLKRRTGRLVFTFHHWDPNAWAELTIGLKSADFKLMNYYVVSSEHPVSVHIKNLNAITHDAILALALDGNSPAERWPPLTRIDTSQSERFCQQCSAAMGWLLESPHSSTEIRAIWKNLIQGRS
jgi:DNA modification methylase